jgi:phosphatidate cytidylyltransferase
VLFLSPVARQRLFDPSVAFDHPATPILLGVVAAALVIPPVVLGLTWALGFMTAEKRRDIWRRYVPWLVLVPVMGVPILLGAFWTILGVAVLAFFCFREYARATGLFREKVVCYLTLLAMAVMYFTALDAWFGLFQAMFPLGIAGIAGLAILQDRPKGYVQRVALAVFALALFGGCLGHVAYAANHWDYRPLIMFFLIAVELNDVMAFTTGRLFGKRKLCPNTSPNKTVAGAVGAVVGTTAFVTLVGPLVFEGTALDHYGRLAVLGVLVSVAGQFGDLTLSSIKRDIGIKDMDVIFPGHGGLLDRFDSALLVAPVAFHYVNFFAGPGPDPPLCIITGAR